MRTKIIISVAIIAILSLGIFLFKEVKTTKQANHITKKTTNARPLPKEVTVTLNKNGFSPKTITITVGSAVRWTNVSGNKQTVNSDNYPSNSLHRELNFGIFNNNSSVVHIFTAPGTYGYHNQLHPEQKGIIVVAK